ncbi:MAG: glucose 1-dehydrogenase [Chloroflexi bacterium]|nr:glucose 1-dehydrogenase [Chloroflexota bacterium]
MRLAGKIAIVTGAASGIGRACAIRYAQEGAKVIVADINDKGGQETVQTISAAGGQAVYCHTDVGVESELQRMIDFTVATYGGLDILHNNAYWTEAKTALETTIENWQRTLDVSLRPCWLASKMAIPHMRTRGKGVILNTASVQSEIGVPGYMAYQAAKGGMMAVTRALAMELAPTIRVVAVMPGAINTPAVAISDEPSVSMDALLRDIPMGRLGEPEEIANVALFLVSDEASYITGTGIMADGGYSTH